MANKDTSKESSSKAINKASSHIVSSNFGRVEAIVLICVFTIMLSLLTRQLTFSFLNDYLIGSTGRIISIVLSVVMALFFYLIFTPLYIGVSKWYYTQARKSGEEYVGIIFYYYKNNSRFIDSIRFDLQRIVRLLIFFIASFLPAGIMGYVIAKRSDSFTDISKLGNTNLMLGSWGLLAAAGLIFYFILSLRYFLARYYFVSEDYKKNLGECFSKSAAAMKGNIGKVLSVIWGNKFKYILCLLVLPLVIVIPIHDMNMANCASAIIGGKDKDKEAE